MHLNHIHPEFDLQYMDQLQHIQRIFEHHPVLSMKKSIIDSLHFQQVFQLDNQIRNLGNLILTKEKPLLQNLQFQKPTLIHTIEKRELHEEEKEFVQKNAFFVKQHFGSIFTPLEEYAIISQTRYYEDAYKDYQQFQQSVDAIFQKKNLFDVLDRQLLLVQKISFKLQTDASFVHTDVAKLKSSILDQQAVLARFPKFSFVN